MKHILFSLLMVAILASCAVPAKRHNITKSWTTPTEFDKLWANTIEMFGNDDIPVGTFEKDSGIIVSDWFVLSEEDGAFIDCGTPPFLSTADKNKVSAKLTVMIRDTEPGGRKVTVNGQYKRRAKKKYYTACFSKGKFERRIYNFITSN